VTKRAIVFESRYAGHTIGYASEFAATFAAAGYKTTFVLNGQAKGRPQIEAVLGTDLAYDIAWTEPFEPEFSSATHGEQELTALNDAVSRFAPDRVIIPTGDSIAKALPLSAQARALEAKLPRMQMVLHHIAAAHRPTGWHTLKRWWHGIAELRALKRHRLLTCDAYIGEGPGQWATKPSGVAVDFLPHILLKKSPFDVAQARAHFGLDPNTKVMVSIGDVAHRKGINHLIAAAEHPNWPAELTLLLAGPVSSKLKPELDRINQELPGRVHVIDRFLSDDEFAAAYVASDIIWSVTPSNMGASSTFMYAALHDRAAIVAQNHPSACWMCDKIGTGIPTTHDPATICETATKALNAPKQTDKQAAFLARITDIAGYERISIAE